MQVKISLASVNPFNCNVFHAFAGVADLGKAMPSCVFVCCLQVMMLLSPE